MARLAKVAPLTAMCDKVGSDPSHTIAGSSVDFDLWAHLWARFFAAESSVVLMSCGSLSPCAVARCVSGLPQQSVCGLIQVLDSDVPSEDIEEEQEARIQCISSFVDIAYGACAWKPDLSTCDALTAPKSGSGGVGTTLSLVLVLFPLQTFEKVHYLPLGLMGMQITAPKTFHLIASFR
jgi:hypothetical protein